jgi:hypothetical protein
VSGIGPTAAAHDLQRRQPLLQRAVGRHEDAQVTLVQGLGLVELGMGPGGGVGADAADALDPGAGLVERREQVLRMGAVDHEVRRRRVGVDTRHGVAQRRSVE